MNQLLNEMEKSIFNWRFKFKCKMYFNWMMPHSWIAIAIGLMWLYIDFLFIKWDDIAHLNWCWFRVSTENSFGNFQLWSSHAVQNGKQQCATFIQITEKRSFIKVTIEHFGHLCESFYCLNEDHLWTQWEKISFFFTWCVALFLPYLFFLRIEIMQSKSNASLQC